jgi:hypothetical protein
VESSQTTVILLLVGLGLQLKTATTTATTPSTVTSATTSAAAPPQSVLATGTV